MIVLDRDPRDLYILLGAMRGAVEDDEKAGAAYLASLHPETREIEIDDIRRRRELLAYLESPVVHKAVQQTAAQESAAIH